MSDSTQRKVAATWQRIFMGVMAVVALLSVIGEFVENPEVVGYSIMQWIRLFSALVGIYFFFYIALKGYLPDWFLKKKGQLRTSSTEKTTVSGAHRLPSSSGQYYTAPFCRNATRSYLPMDDNKQPLLVVNEFHPETVAILDETYTTHHLWKLDDDEQQALIESMQGQCEAVATASWMCNDIIYQLQSLKIIAAFGVGVDAIDFEATGKAGIKVTNTPDVLNDAVADLAIALILATTRNLVNADRFVREGQWLKGPLPFGSGLAGKTLGIAGLGRIGEAIVARALPFGLNIAYHNRSPKDLPYPCHASLQELAAASDILLCMLPGGRATDNLINGAVLEALGPSGIFINVGRGNSVDEQALYDSLVNGRIAAAGLDVYKNEPNVPAQFLELENLVLLPHIGSATVETRCAMGRLVIDNLAAYFAGQPLLTEVR